MCRCEATLYVQKMKDLEEGRADVQIPEELGTACGSRIGLTHAIDDHPGGTVLYDYWKVKRNVKALRNFLRVPRTGKKVMTTKNVQSGQFMAVS
jgi:hypothetical protein